MATDKTKKLYRVRDGIIAGVCGGLADFFGLDPSLIRIATLILILFGGLYPILTRQKNSGLLTYRWEESPQGPPRKYYTLTDKGRDYLKTLDEAWDELVGQIQVIRHGK